MPSVYRSLLIWSHGDWDLSTVYIVVGNPPVTNRFASSLSGSLSYGCTSKMFWCSSRVTRVSVPSSYFHERGSTHTADIMAISVATSSYSQITRLGPTYFDCKLWRPTQSWVIFFALPDFAFIKPSTGAWKGGDAGLFLKEIWLIVVINCYDCLDSV